MSDRPHDAGVPAALADRMREMLGAAIPGSDAAATQLDAAVLGLESLVRRPADQHTALDLLAVDGLVTAAFADMQDAGKIDARAREAAAKLMALGDRSA